MSLVERVYVALGSNLGDREGTLARARASIAQIPLTRLLAVSAAEETDPVGGPPQGRFLNQMALVETSLDPHRFLKALQAIEDREGRERIERWGPRTLDLDIVKFGTRRLRDPDLVVPHPQLFQRAFWLREMEELDQMAPAASTDD